MSRQNIYGRSSPYFNTDIVQGRFLDILDYREIIADPDDVSMTITPTYEFRPDLLAFDLYNNSTLWWVFAARNPNTLGPDPYFNMVAGLQIFIPKQSNIQRALGN
jgi:hypothetical protein